MDITQRQTMRQLDTPVILVTIASVLGIIYGYNFKWGPLLWGLIGLFLGFLLGFIIDLCPKRRKKLLNNSLNNSSTEVVLIIECHEKQAKFIEKILWKNLALGVGRLNAK